MPQRRYVSNAIFIFLAIVFCITMCAQTATARITVRKSDNATNILSIYAPPMRIVNSPYFPYENATREIIVEPDVIAIPTAEKVAAVYADRIIVTPSLFERFNSSLQNWIHETCKRAYAVVLTYGYFDHGLGYLEFSFPNDFKGASCRVFTISVPSYNEILSTLGNGTGVASVDTTDGSGISPVRSWYQSGWFMFLTIAMAITSCAVSCVGVVRLWFYFRATGSCRPQIATICIWFETIGAFIRFLYWGLDPFGSRLIIPYPGSHATFRTASFPFFISSTILLTFYWHETLSTTSLKVSLNVSKFRIPSYLLCALAFLFEIISFVWYFGSIAIATQFRLINQIYYVIVSLGMAIFYIVTATRIFLALQKRSRSSNTSGSSSQGANPEEKAARRKLMDVTIKLSISALSLLLVVAIAPLSLAPFFALAPNSHPGYLAFWFCLHTVTNIKGISTILAFTPPQRYAQSTKATAVSTRSGSKEATLSASLN